MTKDDLSTIYRGYIDCLNRRDWGNLGHFVDANVHYNERLVGLAGYRAMLKDDVQAIPDLSFDIALLLCHPPHVAARLQFDCTPVGVLFDMPVNGRRVRFSENVIYSFDRGRIRNVWSVVDKAAIAAQI